MDVALITVGDELLDGDTVNTNANWLAEQLTERGVDVRRILSVPDEHETVATAVAEYHDLFDAVIVTGGIGGTPDDVTMDAVATAFGRKMTVQETALAAVNQRLAELAERLPDLDVDIDPEAEAALPARSRPLLNEAGLAPGCVIQDVYVLPGIPSELRAMFEQIAPEFSGDRQSQFLYSIEPEANLVPALERTMEKFDVAVGCYPDRKAGHNRLKITGTNATTVTAATNWLRETVNASETPVSRNTDGANAANDPQE